MDWNWFETKQGHKFDFENIAGNVIDIEDIAHSLSAQCRYNGHTTSFYSVAEHSRLLANYGHYVKGLSQQVCLTLLLHDASETYIGDMIGPLKNKFPEFRALEDRIDQRISEVFGTIYPFPQVVKDLDLSILPFEHGITFPKSNMTWKYDFMPPLEIAMDFHTPSKAYHAFMNAYNFFSGLIDNDERDAREMSLDNED